MARRRRLNPRVLAPRSLRYRVLAVVVTVVVLPLAYVWVGGTLESVGSALLRRSLAASLAEAEAALVRGDPLREVAHAHEVRLRVYDAAGALLADEDQAPLSGLFSPVSDPFYGPNGRPRLSEVDAGLPPVPDRPESTAASARPAPRCEVDLHGSLLVCSAAIRDPDGRLLHVIRGSPRLVRSLYEERFQLTALTLGVLLVGIGIALWIGWRMVRPIESLRDQVVERTLSGATDPVDLPRDDELGELATAFNQLLRTVDDRNRANTAFAADLAHELKNPVAAVQAAAEALAADRPVEGERRERLRRVLDDASRRMDAVVQQFLELARAEAGLPGAERERVDVYELVRHVAPSLAGERLDGDGQGGPRIEVSGGPAWVWGVPERIETVVRNLVANAVAHAGPSGRVTVVVREGPDAVELTVSDDGPGIPAEVLPNLFQRYHSTRAGGTGLGLPISRAIVEAHGGRITAESPPGGGARFRILWPGAAQADDSAPEQAT